jgi:hypothetical protein
MGGGNKILKKWEYGHGGPVECVHQAGMTGEVALGDLLDHLVYINADGSVRWKKKMDFTPHAIQITEDGSAIYVLTKNHYLIRMDREGKEQWGMWVMKDTSALASMAKGEAAAVGGIQGTVQIITSDGNRLKLLHVRDPVAYLRFAGGDGGLFAASAMGWVGIYDKLWALRKEYSLRQQVTKMEVNHLGRKVFLPAGEGGLVVIEVAKDDLLTYTTGFSVNAAAVDRQGDRILTTSIDGDMALLDSGGGELWRAKSAAHSWQFCGMASRGDKFILVSGKGYTTCHAILTAREAEEKLDDSYFEFLEL